jgi:RimJ/RimL family protein N-acetyltransferase
MLVPYQPIYFNWLSGWVTSAELLFQFAGTDFHFPLDETQLLSYQQFHTDRRFYIALTENKAPYAFGEIIPQDNNTPRLGRVLIGDPNKRGKGLGAHFIQLLVEECRLLYNPPAVELYVNAPNTAAIQCYIKVGFHFLPNQEKIVTHNGQQHLIKKMRLDL